MPAQEKTGRPVKYATLPGIDCYELDLPAGCERMRIDRPAMTAGIAHPALQNRLSEYA